MIMLYTLLGIIIFICVTYIIWFINFNDNVKKKILITISIIYNGFFGYIDTFFAIILYGYFANMPKGSSYAVPDTEAGFNAMLGIITLIVYLILLLPINFYMKKKSKINFKVYAIINVIATIFGLIIFWIFLDKSKVLF